MSLADALATGDLSRLPSRRDEDWRWSDLRGLIRAAPPPSPTWEGDLPVGPFVALAAEEITIVNGRGPDTLLVAPAAARTVALRLIAAPNSGAHLARLRISVGAGANLTLLESHEGLGADYLTQTNLEIALADGARMERVVAALDAESGVSVSIAEVTLGAQANFSQTLLTTGARRQRLETRVAHPGSGATVRLDGVYELGARRHADITTSVTHEGARGATDQLIKGVVAGQARGVFQGRIIVREGADQTDARMGHHALVLSDTAEVDAKPELEIYADDVACNHGNTIGALDAEALFYAQQRGLSEDEAKALLTQAFLGAVVDRIDHEGARHYARGWVAARLEPRP
jgi:Fe-S cluster assembly protein SufD